MGGGSIIINRRAALLPAVMDPSIYDALSDYMTKLVDAVRDKAPGDTTERDILTLAQAIKEACECG